jgi:hypothetical protein
MKRHNASELKYTAIILDADASTAIASAYAGVEDLSGRRLEQAQSVVADTTHMILFRYMDGRAVPSQGYISVTDPDTSIATLYVVDYPIDPRNPRPRVWSEIYCHATKGHE